MLFEPGSRHRSIDIFTLSTGSAAEAQEGPAIADRTANAETVSRFITGSRISETYKEQSSQVPKRARH
jgi:hypothetical protein